MKQQREHWGSRVGFILAAAGSAIGLGSFWRFPYMAGDNGGGAFVLLYVIFSLFISLPVFIAELIIGRKSQKGAVTAYSEMSRKGVNWKMLGWLNLITCLIILGYYSVVAGWCLNYSLMSLNQFTIGKAPDQIREVFTTLSQSGDINILWLFLFILLNIGVVLSGVRKGIEKWSRILMPGLFVILIGMLIYCFTFEGFSKAAHFIFYPNFSALTPNGVLNALGMAFFTLSVGLGIILTYGSYLKENENLPKTGAIVAVMTLVISLLASLIIFPIVFTYNFPPQGGPGLVFQTMPVLFANLPGNLVISTAFFLLIVFAALTSTISLFEVIIANLIELYSWSRLRSTLITAAGVFLIGIPCALSSTKALFPNWAAIYGKDFFDTLNYVTGSWMMPLAGLLTTIFAGWFMNKQVVLEEFAKGTKKGLFLRPWFFIIRYLAPLVVIIIILQEAGIVDINKLFFFLK